MMNQVIQLRPMGVREDRAQSLEHGMPAIRTDAVYVVHTSIDETLAALHVAGELSSSWGVPMTLVHFRTVPYALPADTPPGISPVQTDAFVDRLRAEHREMRVRVYLCRSERHAIPLAFKPHSVIVIAGRRSWWPRQSERWRRMLEAAGHYVVFVDTPKDRESTFEAEGQGPGPCLISSTSSSA